MKHISLRALLGLGCCLVASPPAIANVIPPAPETAGGTLRPLRGVDVALEREQVEIVQGRSISHRVVATFWLRSHAAEPVELRVAFPLPIAADHPSANRVAESFIVLVDGEPTPLEATEDGPQAAPGWVVWEMRWAPGQTRLVTCVYDVEFPEPVRGIVGGTRIRYQVSTGRHWRGNIGEAIFRYRGESRRWWGGRVVPSYQDNVVQQTEDTIVWRFTDWIPGDEDLTLDLLNWNGLHEPVYPRYVLPRPYSAADRRYDETWLDQLVERELALPLRAFPKKAAALDRTAVRAWIAEHLLMEIRARNGDPFVVGEVGLLERLGQRLGWLGWRLGLQPERPYGGVIRNGVRYSRWSTYFKRYGRSPGGSYDPDPARQESVRLQDLHGLERENAEFLIRILDSPDHELTE